SVTAQAVPPPARISSSSCCRRSRRRAASTTPAPAPARTRAKCCPSPDDAPVTSAIVPVSESNPFDMPLYAFPKSRGPASSSRGAEPAAAPARPTLARPLFQARQVVRVGKVAEADAPLDRLSRESECDPLDSQQWCACGHSQRLGGGAVGGD